MQKARFVLPAASALVLLAGSALLATPATAADFFACTESQKTYVRSVVSDVCGSDGGTGYMTCDGADVDIVGIRCN
jgi:hypothetical protein